MISNLSSVSPGVVDVPHGLSCETFSEQTDIYFRNIEALLQDTTRSEFLPGQSVMSSKEVVAAVMESYQELLPVYEMYLKTGNSSLFSPGQVTNSAFSRLVNIGQTYFRPAVLKESLERLSDKQDILNALKQMCYLGEAAMELHFARQTVGWIDEKGEVALDAIKYAGDFGAQGVTDQDFHRKISMLEALFSPPDRDKFPYIDNYTKMIQQSEYFILSQILSRTGATESPTLSFLGSGPMDLSSVIMIVCDHSLGNGKLKVVSIDRDTEAVEVSQKLTSIMEKLEIFSAGRKKVIHGDAANLNFTKSNYGCTENNNCPSDVLFIAAMIPEEIRNSILKKVQENSENPISGVMMRDAHGLVASLLYPKVNTQILKDNDFSIIQESHPVSQILNDYLLSCNEHIRIVSQEIVNSTIGAINNKARKYT
jgi:hypothetical protein